MCFLLEHLTKITIEFQKRDQIQLYTPHVPQKQPLPHKIIHEHHQLQITEHTINLYSKHTIISQLITLNQT